MTHGKIWRRFGPRDPHEEHRASTPLELLFDLVIVIAIASAAEGLHHGIVTGRGPDAMLTFVFAFFATWWAWMNFTWFASAYDNDGPVYRAITCWIMAGALLVAAGIPRFFTGLDLALGILGYIVMRVGMIAFWLISAQCDPAHRRTALAYAAGIAAVQVYWTLALLVFRPALPAAAFALFALGIALELAVPALAERCGMTPWHRDHLIERHGLFTIIVLGEVLLSSSVAFAAAAKAPQGAGPALALLAVASLVITFAMWWLYFSQEGAIAGEDRRSAFAWGYLHAPVFASVAATGAGFLVAIDALAGHARVSAPAAALAVALPLAGFLAALWLVRDRLVLAGARRHVLLPFATALPLAALLPLAPALAAMAALCVAALIVRSGLAAPRET